MKVDYPFLVWIMVVVAFGLHVEVSQKRSVASDSRPYLSEAASLPYAQLAREGQFVQPLERLESIYTNEDNYLAKGFNQNCVPSELETNLHEELKAIINKMRVSNAILSMQSTYDLKKIMCQSLAQRICNVLTPEQKHFVFGATHPGRRTGESLSDYIARMKLLKILGLKPKTSIAALPSADHLSACEAAGREYKAWD
jgi:hypothetical protein